MRLFRSVEFIIVFVLLPVVIWLTNRLGLYLELPTLLLTSSYSAWRLVATGSSTKSFFSFRGVAPSIPGILIRWSLGTALLLILTRRFAPEQLLAFPRQRPALWTIVMLLYPVLSAYPQEIIYRPFLFQAYPALHRSSDLLLIVFSATVYSFVHVVYNNWIAVVLTFAGGLMFAHNYLRTRSLPAVWIEHSLWGNMIFTVGLGRYFYHSWT